jgi:hypothetical protein
VRSLRTTLTYVATIYGPNGQPRHVAVSLPYVACISSEPRYAGSTDPPRVGETKLVKVKAACRNEL